MVNVIRQKYIFKFWLILFLTFFIVSPFNSQAASDNSSLRGKILLQVEENGEAWYVYPGNTKRYYLGRPADAFQVMRKLSLGATHEFILQNVFPARLAGMILLDVERNGEAYYIHTETLKKHYLSRPADAFAIMRAYGLGITNDRLSIIPVGDIENITKEIVNTSTSSSYINNVPFTTQAPFANWSDQRQQDGCEEASALMAVYWARGETLSKQEALDGILGISDYILDKYGEYRDISSLDAVAWIYNDYFKFDYVESIKGVSKEDIISELAQGNLVVAPMNGQILGNPNFTPPGPSRHMLVIRGYNIDKDVFITNDPGTRMGENYKYDSSVFFNAIRDYPTGYHKTINKIEKNIIVVEK